MAGTRKIPILLHMGMAAMGLAENPITRGETLSDDFWHDSDEGQVITANMEKTLRGLQKYISCAARSREEPEILWQEGETRLRVFSNPKAHYRMLIIPSLINGYEILDIHPERSFARYFSHNFEVMIVEWGDLKQDSALQSFETILTKRMGAIMQFLNKDDRPMVGVGYCMGGILLAATDILYPKAFQALSFIATPWDFKQNVVGNFAEHLLNWAETGIDKMRAIDYVPADWLQMIFMGVEPSQIARKFSAFHDMPEGDIQTEIFIAVEDWLNGGADIPSSLLLTSVIEWYQQNLIYKGKWMCAGHKIAASSIQKPCHVIVPKRDRIVPYNAALALVQQLPNGTLLETDGGHISLMISKAAREAIWKPLEIFLIDALR